MATNQINNHVKKYDVLDLIAEPNEIMFTNYVLGEKQQKQLKLRNISILPVIIANVDIHPRNIFQIKINKKYSKRKYVAPGLCVVILVEFLPVSLEEINGIISVHVEKGKTTIIKVTACRRYPILTSYTDTHNLHTRPDNVLNFGKCLIGSTVTLEKKIKNVGRNGKFVLVDKKFLWNEIKKEDLHQKNNTLHIEPFSINPAAFSAEENSEIHFMCKFFPNKSGIHIENIIVTTDSCDLQTLTLIGEAFKYDPKMIFIKDSKKLLNIPTEENSNKFCFIDMGILLPFTTKSKKIEVINNCDISFNYTWVPVEDSFGAQTQTPFLDTSNISWSVKPTEGKLKRKINDFSFEIRMNDCSFGKFRHIFGLILECIPIISLKSDEMCKTKTALGSFETQREGFVNLLVEKVEICVECAHLDLEIHPALILLPTSMKSDKPVVNEVSILNKNDVPVYYSWRSDKKAEEYESEGIILEAKIIPLESCIPPHSTQKLIVTLQIKFWDDVISDHMVSLTFIGRTWYMASNSSSEVECYAKSKDKVCKVIQGQSLKFNFLGCIADAKVKLCSRLDMAEFDNIIDFGRVSRDAVVQKKIFLQNASKQKFLCQITLLRNEENPAKLTMISNDINNVFSVFPDSLVMDNNSHKEAILKFHPREEGSYCQLIAVSGKGTLPGPFWDFALISGKVVPPSIIINPSTSKDTPYEIPKTWAGTSVSLHDVSLRNQSNHFSFLTAFHWSDPIVDDSSQLEVFVQPKSGMIRAQETISFSMNVQIKSKELKQFILPCFVEQNRDPLLLYFKCDVESPMISFYSPKDDLDEICNDSELMAMGFSEDDLIVKDREFENQVWNVDFNNGPVITFKGVSTYRVEVRELSIENKSPFELNYDCGLKNFAGKVKDQKYCRWKCPVGEHEDTDDYSQLKSGQSRITTLLELKPKEGKLKPWEKSTIEIWLLGSTWGLYYDEITVKLECAEWNGEEISLKPPLLKLICISQIISHPLCFPATINSKNNILRFGTSSCQNETRERTVYIRNTSCIDIIVIWDVHARLEDNQFQSFQLGLHEFNKNIFEYMREISESNEHQKYLMNVHYTNEMLNQAEGFIMKQMEGNPEDISTEIAILPVIGPKSDDVFKVSQWITIIPSHSERRLKVTFNCGNYSQSSKSFLGTLVGYVHISPENSNSSSLFMRPQGTKLNPILLTLAANQTIPKLIIRHDKDKSVMKLSAQKYLAKNTQGILKSFQKSIILKNESNGATNFQIKVDEPLFITAKDETAIRIRKTRQIVSEFIIQPDMEIEIVVIYEAIRKELDWIVTSMKNLHNKTPMPKLPGLLESSMIVDNETNVTIKKKITISHDDYEMEVIPLELVYMFPSVTVSVNNLNFGSIIITASKENEFKIMNDTTEAVKFRTSISQTAKVFSAKPKECLIHGIKDFADSFATIYVKFKPMSPGYFTGVLLITMEGGIKDLQVNLCGSGFKEVSKDQFSINEKIMPSK